MTLVAYGLIIVVSSVLIVTVLSQLSAFV